MARPRNEELDTFCKNHYIKYENNGKQIFLQSEAYCLLRVIYPEDVGRIIKKDLKDYASVEDQQGYYYYFIGQSNPLVLTPGKYIKCEQVSARIVKLHTKYPVAGDFTSGEILSYDDILPLEPKRYDLVRDQFHKDIEYTGNKIKLTGKIFAVVSERTDKIYEICKNYCHFEDWFSPLLDTMLEEQKTKGTVWSPSKMIARMGKEINNEESVYYWCWKNNIPVMCPSLTDGSVGDMIYFHSYKNPGFVLDIAQDIRIVNDKAVRAKKTGMLILGGGLVKHHICNANLMRNGADFAVFVNTGQEFDGSDSGARPDEAVSWGKISLGAKPVKVYADASMVLPLLVSQTFARSKDGLTMDA